MSRMFNPTESSSSSGSQDEDSDSSSVPGPSSSGINLNFERLITFQSLSLTRDQTISMRSQFIPSACALHFEKSPLKLVAAKGQYLYDDTGSEFLDCVNCVAHVGHCHPDVLKAGRSAMAEIGPIPPLGPSQVVSSYISQLKTTLPPELDTFLFVSSASEANDLALQLARLHTGGTDVVSLEHSFHGGVSIPNQISGRIYGNGGSAQMPQWVHVIPCPDLYRGKYREDDPVAVSKYCEDATKVMENAVKSGKRLCCYIGEPIMNAGGMIIPPSEWTQSVYRDIRSHGGVVIADEAQSGLGRSGEAWWSFQTQGVIPDIITIGKPLGNGHPMAVVVTREQIASSLGDADHSHSFACDNVSAAIGSAVINAIRNEKLQINARNVGDFLVQGIQALKGEHPNIGCVRGRGLMIGVEIVYNQETRKPAKDIAEKICYMMKDNNIIVANDGQYKNVLIFTPPMCFTCENAHRVITTLDKVLKTIEADDELNLDYRAVAGPSSSIMSYDSFQDQPGPSTSRGPTRNRLITPEMIFGDSEGDGEYQVSFPYEDDDCGLEFSMKRSSSTRYEEMD